MTSATYEVKDDVKKTHKPTTATPKPTTANNVRKTANGSGMNYENNGM